MPEIDTELFQWLVLGLLVLVVIITLVAVSTLSKLKRNISEASPAPAETAPQETPVAEPARQPLEEPAPESGHTTAPGSAYTTAPEPGSVAEPTVTPESVAPEEVTRAPAGGVTQEVFPEEEPFERDGRWWFKRGGELLVYDEGSGQWEPAPTGTMPSGATPAPTTTGRPAGQEAAVEGGGEQAEPAAEGAEPAAGFWKCASCGAINGATATSCRMCFTARP